MLVAVTGSHGLIGSALCRRLSAAGHEVLPVVRHPTAPEERAVSWDPDAGSIDAAGLEGVDAVVHLAGEGIGERRWTDEQKRRILESRTKGTAVLAEALAGLDRPPSVLLSGSAIGYYGDRGDEVLVESSGAGDDFLADVCVAWEDAATPAIDAGIRTTFLRTGIVLSPDGGALARMLTPFKLGVGGRIGSGDQWWSPISLHDEIAAIEFLLTNDVPGPVNLTLPEPLTNAAFTKVLGQVLGRPTLVPIPTFGPKLLFGAELVEALLLASQRVDSSKLTDAGFAFQHPDVESALRAALGRPG